MKRYLSILLAAFLFVTVFSTVTLFETQEAKAADHVMFQEIIEKSEVKSEDNAYILFSNEPKMSKMSFEDGSDGERYTTETFNERIIFNGVEGRQVWKENYLYMRFDPSFASPEDSLFKVEIDYWDYSGIGWFFVDYTTAESDTNYNRVSVLKEGNPDGDPKWHTLTFYLTDASFRQAMPYGCDLKIVTNAFNTFSRIEVTNLSGGKQDSTEELGTFNTMQEGALKHLELYKGVPGSESYEAGLDKFMTKEEFIHDMYYAAGFDEEALAADITPKAQNVSAEFAPYVGYAEQNGVITEGEVFDSKANLTQKEMLIYYSRLLNLEGDFENNTYKAACDTQLILKNEAVFQMNKNVTRDNFVGIAANVLLVPYKDGKSLLEGMMMEKKVTGQMIYDCGYGKLFDWMITRTFYLGHRTRVDETTGRTYHQLDFFGEDAIKNYFTMPMTSADDTRFYFRDNKFRMYEYNMVTGMCTYIDTGMWNFEHAFCTDGQNNFYYLNQNWEFIRMDCDDHSKKEVVAVWPKEQRPSSAVSPMLQTTYDGKWMSIYSGKGDLTGVIPQRYGVFPVCNLETGEWTWDAAYYGNFKHLADGWVTANHNCINPVYPNLQFFAHEGAPTWDRVWVVDMDTQEYINVNKTRIASDGDYGITSGCHEFWCHCGQHIGWASNDNWLMRKSTHRDEIAGFTIANWDGSDVNYVNADLGYNHPSISHDHRFGVGDDQLHTGQGIEIRLIDIQLGDSILLCEPACVDNPGHPHPQFSWNDNLVFFGLGSDDFKYTNIGWMDISDIREERAKVKGGQYDLSESCETFGYEGYEHYIEPMEDTEDGSTYYKIPKGNKMNVNIKPSVVENFGATVKLKITYLDKGASDLSIHYRTYDRQGNTGTVLDKYTYLERKNTGKWITKEIIIDPMDTGNPLFLKTDFQIYGLYSDAYIKSIEAECLGTTDYTKILDSGGNGGYVAAPWAPRYPR